MLHAHQECYSPPPPPSLMSFIAVVSRLEVNDFIAPLRANMLLLKQLARIDIDRKNGQ